MHTEPFIEQLFLALIVYNVEDLSSGIEPKPNATCAL